MAKHPSLCVALLVAITGAAGNGCTTYSELDAEERRDVRTPIGDGGAPSSDRTFNDTELPPADTGGKNDTGGAIDAPVGDASRDASAEVAPPPDVTTRDVGDGNDVSVGADATADVTPPSPDADAGVPPGPETGPDVTAPPDVFDAAPRDADAAAPPADADGGTGPIDARDAGPTCWGTPSTHDEDGDGLVDECDNCPSVANANQADVGEVNMGGTADGVGDACDPRPNSGGDSIFFFDGMNFTTIPSTWTNVGNGTWTASGTSLSPTDVTAGQELERSFPSALGNYLSEATFTFTAVTTSGSASIPFRTDGSRNGWGCAVGINGTTGSLFLTQVTGGAGETNPPSVAINAPQVGSRYRLLAGAYSTNVYCFLNATDRVNRTTSGSTSGESGIRASGVSARFDYLLVYRLGGTVP